jgi:SAM-dependent methyltransferase
MKNLKNEIIKEFSYKSKKYIKLDFLNKVSKSKIYVSKITGLVFQKDFIKKEDNKKKWDKIFSNKFIPEKNLFTSETPFFLSRHYYAVMFLKKFLIDNKFSKKKFNILDAGAGEGNLGFLVKKFLPKSNISLIEILKKNILKIKKKYSPKEIYHGNIEDSHFAKTIKFDVCFLTWTLCNCSSPIKVLEKINTLLNKDGFLLIGESSRILVPYKKSIKSYFNSKKYSPQHPWHFSFNSISNLLEISGFRISFVNSYNEENDMFIIAKKINNLKPIFKIDNYKTVISFLKRWKKESLFFEKNKL